jgi:ribosomal protein S18 acetylase RimI-like enzyme
VRVYRLEEYDGAPALRDMQDLTARLWSHASGSHVGDLAWGAFQHEGREGSWRTALWYAGGVPVAWAWLRLPGHLDLAADPARGPGLVASVLDWFERTAPAPRSVGALDAEDHVVPLLTERGYRPGPYLTYLGRDLADLPPLPSLPPGHRVRSVTAEDLVERVAVHAAAWHPTRVTAASYRNVMAAWPYEPGLDQVVEGPDGRFVASCLIWPDDVNGVGELEPVGAHPDHRGLGFGAAACLAALHALRERGATRAVVYTATDGHPGAIPLYLSLGFATYAQGLLFTREDREG